MTALEYMKKKNKLVFKVTGKVLIPKDQLVDVEFSDEFEPEEWLNATNCPYCNLHESCETCPMALAGNQCRKMDDYGNPLKNTFSTANEAWLEKSTEKTRQKLYRLGVKYLESNTKLKDLK
jgi:hypothetical protein